MEEGILAILVGGLMFVGVPVIYMLIKHQQRMAELIHGKPGQPLPAVMTDPALVNEIVRLRDVVAQQSIAIDNLAASQRQLASALSENEDLRARLKA